MKKFFAGMSAVLFLILILPGCNTAETKSGNLTVVYSITAILSLILLIGCIFSIRKKHFWFITLFSSVFVVNFGYSLLSVSSSLNMALWANRISYLGSVFLPLSMLMIILSVTDTPYRKRLPNILFCFAILVFLIAASPGILPLYYKEISFEIVNGVSKLIKVYGPLHPIYLVYLLGYFSAMVAVIIRANIKKTIDTTAHAVFIAIAVFVNIGIWLIEQFVDFNFEMLSISYIISEIFLMGVHLVMSETQHLRKAVNQLESVQNFSDEETTSPETMLKKEIEPESVSPERMEFFINGLSTLTPTEKTIYEAHLARVTSKEIMANMNIKESTLKYHNRNLYGKLGVSNRKELLELHKHIKAVKSKLNKTKNSAE